MKIPLAIPRLIGWHIQKAILWKSIWSFLCRTAEAPLVEVSLNCDIALYEDEATTHPSHHWEPGKEPGVGKIEVCCWKQEFDYFMKIQGTSKNTEIEI